MKNLLSELDAIKHLFIDKPVYIFLDLDGTLAPIAKFPHLAKVPRTTRNTLKKLSEVKGINIMIVSGRDIGEIKSMLRLDNIAFSGSHGLEIEGLPDTPPLPVKSRVYADTIKNIASKIKDKISHISGIFFEQKKFSFAVHYRLVKKSGIAAVEDAVKQIIFIPAANKEIKLQAGKKVIEILPPVDWNKGNVVKYVLQKRRNHTAVYIGDDLTDEHAFKFMLKHRNGITACVGRKQHTFAKYYLKNTKEVAKLLDKLRALR